MACLTLIWLGWFGCTKFGTVVFEGLVWQFDLVGLIGLICQVWFSLDWLVWFNLVNEDDLKRPIVPSKVVNASLELHPRTIPGGSVELSPIVIIRLSQFKCNCCLMELSLAILCATKLEFLLYCLRLLTPTPSFSTLCKNI